MARNDITIADGRGGPLGALLFVLLAAAALPACSDEASSSPWTKFVQVAGQPDPVPEQWVSTPEGKFAHAIVIPNPVSKDSGYRPGMSSKDYFQHLCKTEAGEFIFRKVDGVKGFYFMRPPARPTDDDLKDRYKLEAPDIERTFQLVGNTPKDRATIFVAPPFNLFAFVEQPVGESGRLQQGYVRASGYWSGTAPMQIDLVDTLSSTYGVTWRGIRRGNDREHAIAGSEWIVLDLRTREVLAVMRNYGLTGRTRGTKEGIWWLNALSCPAFAARYRNATSERIYNFVSATLKPLVKQNRR